MLVFYGTMQCKHCQAFTKGLQERAVDYEIREISELPNLKAFLQIRDREKELFSDIVSEGRVGIPLIVNEDGSYTLDYEQFISSSPASGEER